MEYFIQYNIGKAKYVLTYHAGKFYADGSKFYDVLTFQNKTKLDKAIKNLPR